ncbi:MAG: plasma-membrane proton-efflux P-type ATPase, partial [Desulfurococcaceae archaeon]
VNLPYPQMQSFIFYILLLTGLLNILNFRETGPFWGSRPGEYMLLAITVDSVVATILVWKGIIIPALPLNTMALALTYVIATFLVTDVAKIAVFKAFNYT